MSESEAPDPSGGLVQGPTPAPTLESIPGTVPGAGTARGRYVRLFGWVVVILIVVAIGWGAVTLVSAVHRG